MERSYNVYIHTIFFYLSPRILLTRSCARPSFLTERAASPSIYRCKAFTYLGLCAFLNGRFIIKLYFCILLL